jgi:hypothetical protein
MGNESDTIAAVVIGDDDGDNDSGKVDVLLLLDSFFSSSFLFSKNEFNNIENVSTKFGYCL